MWLCGDMKSSVFCSHIVNIFMSFQNIEIQGGGSVRGEGSVRKSCDWKTLKPMVWHLFKFISVVSLTSGELEENLHLPPNWAIKVPLEAQMMRNASGRVKINFLGIILAIFGTIEKFLNFWYWGFESTQNFKCVPQLMKNAIKGKLRSTRY